MEKVLPITLLVSNLTPMLFRVIDLAADDVARQAEGRDAVLEHAADHVQRLEYGDVAAVARQVGGDGEARRARSRLRDPPKLALEARRHGLWRARCRR